MRLLYLGDIVGRSGRDGVLKHLPDLIAGLKTDFVVINGENAAGGFGITPKICDELYAAGTDVIVTGNHVWDNREIMPHFQREPRLIRPANFPPGATTSGNAMSFTMPATSLTVQARFEPIFSMETGATDFGVTQRGNAVEVRWKEFMVDEDRWEIWRSRDPFAGR